MSDFTFHVIEIILESGLLTTVLYGIWKSGAIVQDFNTVKEAHRQHIADDKENFKAINGGISELAKGQARIEGRLNGGYYRGGQMP